MSTSTEKAPAFTTTVDYDGVTIKTPEGAEYAATRYELHDGGWHEDDACAPCELTHTSELDGNPHEIIKVWHDEESGHGGPFQFCYEEPCKALSEALSEWNA